MTLKERAEKQVPVEELWFARELEYRLMKQSRMLDHSLKHMSLKRFHETAFRLGAGVMRQVGMMPRKVRLARAMDTARSIANAAGSIFFGWPAGFFATLDELVKFDYQTVSARPEIIFGTLYQEISDCQDKDSFFIREAFDLYLHARLPHLARRLRTRPRS